MRQALRVYACCVKCDFEVRILRDLNQQALKLVSDAVRQSPEIGVAAHHYFSQVSSPVVQPSHR